MKLNKEYKFDNFEITKGNKLAFTLSQDIAQEPGKKYSPLFISGNKTERVHLLNAIANYIIEKFKYKVSYINVTEVNEIIKEQDILIIDELEKISNEEDKLKELIKAYTSNNKQIVLGSNKPFDKLNITKELKEIILWGITVNIENDKTKINNKKLTDYDWLSKEETINKKFFKIKEDLENINNLVGKYIIYNQYIDNKYYSTFRGKLLNFKNDILYVDVFNDGMKETKKMREVPFEQEIPLNKLKSIEEFKNYYNKNFDNSYINKECKIINKNNESIIGIIIDYQLGNLMISINGDPNYEYPLYFIKDIEIIK